MHPPSGKTLPGGGGKQGVVTLQHKLDDGQPPSGAPTARERAASMR
ncbi:MAG: hypothetical protein LBL48_12305 [Azoarcus sp.]|jgi:hypothetical protein|nr:hypothetical protein [Azoarcus sp.]